MHRNNGFSDVFYRHWPCDFLYMSNTLYKFQIDLMYNSPNHVDLKTEVLPLNNPFNKDNIPLPLPNGILQKAEHQTNSTAKQYIRNLTK